MKPAFEIQTPDQIKSLHTETLRRDAKISRAELCIALANLKLLTDDDCVAAAKGDWPAPFTEFLKYLTPSHARNTRALWAAAPDIYRNDSTILALAWWFQIDDATADKIFGIAD